MGTRSSEVKTGWKMLTSPYHSLQKADDLINEESFAEFILSPITSNFKSSPCCWDFLSWGWMRRKEKWGKIYMSLCKTFHGNHSSVTVKMALWPARKPPHISKWEWKQVGKEICNKFLLSQTINFHTKLHNIFCIIFPITKSCP